MRQTADSSPYVPEGLRLDEEPGSSGARGVIPRCCGYIPENRQWNFSQVFSTYWRLYLNFGPGHHIIHNGHSLPLTPGRFVLIPENVLFHCHSPKGAPGHLYVHFSLPPGRASLLDAPLSVPAGPLGVGMAKELSRTIAHSGQERAEHQAAALVHWAFSHVAGKKPLTRLPSPSLQKALSLIETRLGGDLSNPAIARASGISVRCLVRTFHDEFRESPQRHVRKMRLREAARRLAHGPDSIEQIAGDLGFPNRFYFTRCFTRLMQWPPAEFRRRVQQKNASVRLEC